MSEEQGVENEPPTVSNSRLWSCALPTCSNPPCDIPAMITLPIAWAESFVDAALGHRCHSLVFAESLGLDILCNDLWWSPCVRPWLCLFDPHPVGA